MSSIALPTLSVDRGLSAYLREIRAFPFLTSDEEIALARRWRDDGDVDAARTLVTSHLRLVVKIASQYRKFTLPFEDLISEGNIGLMKAVRKFDPDKGFRLSTYALWWIKAEIMEFVLKSWSLVRIGSITLQKKLFYNLKRAKMRLRTLDTARIANDNDERLAEEFGLSVQEVRALGNRLEKGDLSLDQPAASYDDGDGESYLERLKDPGADPECRVLTADQQAYRRWLIDHAMSGLSARDKEIIRARWLGEERATLEDLGQRFGVSRERIRQLEERALKTIGEGISSHLGTQSTAEISRTLLSA